MSDKPIVTALRNTAAWLAANPDKHISGRLAEDKNYNFIKSPFAPEAACFCAYGRMLVELDALGEPVKTLFEKEYLDHDRPDADFYGPMHQRYGILYEEVYMVNDSTRSHQGNRRVIPFLQDKADALAQSA